MDHSFKTKQGYRLKRNILAMESRMDIKMDLIDLVEG